jgi:hypothetical protein
LESKHPTSPAKKNVQNAIVSRKSDVNSFWDSQAPILEHYQESGIAVNNTGYSERSGACVACHATKNNFSEGIQKLVSPWTKCIEKK